MLAAGVALGSIPSTAKDSPRLRVLVVDDEPLIRWSLSETLEQSGHAVVEAGDALNAVRSVSAGEPFDVVLLDYRLPDSNDLELLATIRALAPAAAGDHDDGVRHARSPGGRTRARRLPGATEAIRSPRRGRARPRGARGAALT